MVVSLIGHGTPVSDHLRGGSTLQYRTTGRRLALAVTAALSVTALGAGTLATAPPALAATAAVPLTIDQVDVPAVLELDKTSTGVVTLQWKLSRADADLDVTFTHVATGKKVTQHLTQPTNNTWFSLTWRPEIEEADSDGVAIVDAPNGAYTVSVKATPDDGIGAPVSKTSQTNIVRAFNPHDLNDNGSTDVLFREPDGTLWRTDMRDFPYYGEFRPTGTYRIGAGWGVYKQIEAVGNIAGSKHGDVIALDGSGVLWHYQGRGNGSFAGRVKVGGGWGGYSKLAGGSDLNGDGRPDLLATDSTGTLWFYRGTGSSLSPFAARVKVGGGWGVYNHLTAVGNIAGTAAGDLVARDKSGVLWLYQGRGNGSFSGRVQVGGGWQGFKELVGAGDLDNDGRPDLIAYGPSGVSGDYVYGSRVYLSTGVITGPFTRRVSTLFLHQGDRYGTVA
ncbi:FG-GAP repeat domain-containing protein [Streptomyces hydrogenans]|uniref:FG-GAP repeat domain-containing protein n=1 Tax=Streptomyces hydrogenans TaxID=1873719 RepID=UPI003812B124